jgi:hypothetical protein
VVKGEALWHWNGLVEQQVYRHCPRGSIVAAGSAAKARAADRLRIRTTFFISHLLESADSTSPHAEARPRGRRTPSSLKPRSEALSTKEEG